MATTAMEQRLLAERESQLARLRENLVSQAQQIDGVAAGRLSLFRAVAGACTASNPFVGVLFAVARYIATADADSVLDKALDECRCRRQSKAAFGAWRHALRLALYAQRHDAERQRRLARNILLRWRHRYRHRLRVGAALQRAFRLGRKAAMRHALHRLRFAPTITVANPDAPTRRKYLSLWRRAAFRFRSRSANVMGVALARLEAQWCLARHLSMWKAARERRQRIRRGLDLIRNKIEKPRARTAFRRWLTSTVVCLRKHADLKRVTRHRRMLRTLRVWVGHAAHRRRSRLLIGRMLGLSRTMPVRYAFARWRQVAFAERHAERRRYLLHSIARRIADRNPVRVAFQTWRLNAFRNNLPGVDTVPFDMFACVVRQRIRSKTWSRWRSRWLLRRSARQALSRLVNVARIATMRLALNRLRERVLSSSSATVLFKAFLALRLNVKLKRTRNRKLGMALGRLDDKERVRKVRFAMMALRRNYELAVSSDRFLEHNRVAKRASMFRSWRMATLRRRHIKQALANACKRLHRLQLSHVFSRMKRVVADLRQEDSNARQHALLSSRTVLTKTFHCWARWRLARRSARRVITVFLLQSRRSKLRDALHQWATFATGRLADQRLRAKMTEDRRGRLGHLMVMFARHDERRALRVWRSLASSMRQADDNADRDHAEATAAVLDAFVRRRRAFLAWRTYIARQRAAIGTIIRFAKGKPKPAWRVWRSMTMAATKADAQHAASISCDRARIRRHALALLEAWRWQTRRRRVARSALARVLYRRSVHLRRDAWNEWRSVIWMDRKREATIETLLMAQERTRKNAMVVDAVRIWVATARRSRRCRHAVARLRITLTARWYRLWQAKWRAALMANIKHLKRRHAIAESIVAGDDARNNRRHMRIVWNAWVGFIDESQQRRDALRRVLNSSLSAQILRSLRRWRTTVNHDRIIDTMVQAFQARRNTNIVRCWLHQWVNVLRLHARCRYFQAHVIRRRWLAKWKARLHGRRRRRKVTTVGVDALLRLRRVWKRRIWVKWRQAYTRRRLIVRVLTRLYRAKVWKAFMTWRMNVLKKTASGSHTRMSSVVSTQDVVQQVLDRLSRRSSLASSGPSGDNMDTTSYRAATYSLGGLAPAPGLDHQRLVERLASVTNPLPDIDEARPRNEPEEMPPIISRMSVVRVSDGDDNVASLRSRRSSVQFQDDVRVEDHSPTGTRTTFSDEQKGVQKRIMKLWRGANLFNLFAHWRSFVAEQKGTRERLGKRLSRLDAIAKFRALHHWRTFTKAAAAQSIVDAVEARRRKETMDRVIRNWKLNLQRVRFRVWVDFVHECKTLRRCLAKLTTGALARSLRQWRAVSKRVAHERSAVGRAVKLILSAAKRFAWKRWTAIALAMKVEERMLEQERMKLAEKASRRWALDRTFRKWSRMALSRAWLRRVLHHTFTATRTHTLMTTMRSWRATCIRERQVEHERKILTRFMRYVWRTNVANGWRFWRSFIDKGRIQDAKKRLRRSLNHMASSLSAVLDRHRQQMLFRIWINKARLRYRFRTQMERLHHRSSSRQQSMALGVWHHFVKVAREMSSRENLMRTRVMRKLMSGLVLQWATRTRMRRAAKRHLARCAHVRNKVQVRHALQCWQIHVRESIHTAHTAGIACRALTRCLMIRAMLAWRAHARRTTKLRRAVTVAWRALTKRSVSSAFHYWRAAKFVIAALYDHRERARGQKRAAAERVCRCLAVCGRRRLAASSIRRWKVFIGYERHREHALRVLIKNREQHDKLALKCNVLRGLKKVVLRARQARLCRLRRRRSIIRRAYRQWVNRAGFHSTRRNAVKSCLRRCGLWVMERAWSQWRWYIAHDRHMHDMAARPQCQRTERVRFKSWNAWRRAVHSRGHLRRTLASCANRSMAISIRSAFQALRLNALATQSAQQVNDVLRAAHAFLQWRQHLQERRLRARNMSLLLARTRLARQFNAWKAVAERARVAERERIRRSRARRRKTLQVWRTLRLDCQRRRERLRHVLYIGDRLACRRAMLRWRSASNASHIADKVATSMAAHRSCRHLARRALVCWRNRCIQRNRVRRGLQRLAGLLTNASLRRVVHKWRYSIAVAIRRERWVADRRRNWMRALVTDAFLAWRQTVQRCRQLYKVVQRCCHQSFHAQTRWALSRWVRLPAKPVQVGPLQIPTPQEPPFLLVRRWRRNVMALLVRVSLSKWRYCFVLARIVSLSKEKSALLQAKDDLEAEISSSTAAIDVVKSNNARLQSKLDDLQSRTGRLQSERNGLLSRLALANSQLKKALEEQEASLTKDAHQRLAQHLAEKDAALAETLQKHKDTLRTEQTLLPLKLWRLRRLVRYVHAWRRVWQRQTALRKAVTTAKVRTYRRALSRWRTFVHVTMRIAVDRLEATVSDLEVEREWEKHEIAALEVDTENSMGHADYSNRVRTEPPSTWPDIYDILEPVLQRKPQ
ncbi:Sfi1 spindle body domain-containing protein [Plasmodiophora brassicae]